MGGNDDPSNIVELTVEEHAQAHYELWEKYGKNEDLLAYKGLKKLISKEEILREVCSHKGKNNPMYGKKGKDNPNYGKKRSMECRKKQSNALKKYCQNRSEEHTKNLRAACYNESTNKKRVEGIAKEWEITFPDGNKKIIHNMKKWCDENGFSKSSVSGAARSGKRHKDHVFRKIG